MGFFRKKNKGLSAEEKYYMSTQWQLMARKFVRHKLAIVGMIILGIMYTIAIFSEFFAVYNVAERNVNFTYVAPQKIRLITDEGFPLRPYVHPLIMKEDPYTWRKYYAEDETEKFYLQFFAKTEPYKLLGLIDMDVRFVSVEEGATLFLLGTDRSGRDLYSRILDGLRISLTIGLVGVAFTFVLGCVFGGISGYYGGKVDVVIQRMIEFLMSIPAIPLWMALAAAMPQNWPVVKMYFAITIILSLVGWTGLARVIRGKFLQLREADFVMEIGRAHV